MSSKKRKLIDETSNQETGLCEQPTPAERSEADKKIQSISRTDLRLLNARAEIELEEAKGDNLVFMHSVMCQLGLPRSKYDGLEFIRMSGGAGLHVQAGRVYNGVEFIQYPIPYGTLPRLILAHLNSEALRNQSPVIDVEKSAAAFLKKLGRGSTGGKTGSLTNLRRQILSIAACSINFGLKTNNDSSTPTTYYGKPVSKLDAWVSNEKKKVVWPKTMEFSKDYFDALKERAVPLDVRALQALSGSALAMDVYVWMAERLHRVHGRPVTLYWSNLREQFGQEYTDSDGGNRNFKRAFREALRRAKVVYPDAKVDVVHGGIKIHHSNPPVDYKPTPEGNYW